MTIVVFGDRCNDCGRARELYDIEFGLCQACFERRALIHAANVPHLDCEACGTAGTCLYVVESE